MYYRVKNVDFSRVVTKGVGVANVLMRKRGKQISDFGI